jgi:hypothetical protein
MPFVCLCLANAGSEAAERVTTEGLASDMAAFKAANPGAVLEVGEGLGFGGRRGVRLWDATSWAARCQQTHVGQHVAVIWQQDSLVLCLETQLRML